MTKAEQQTKKPAVRVKPTAQTGQVTIDLASIVNVEAIYGRPLLDEVAAVTAELASRKDDLQAFMVRATGAVRAASAAEGRIVDLDGSKGAPDGLFEVVQVMSGLEALNGLALEVGIQWSIFEADEPGDSPVEGQFVPGVFGQ